MTPPASGRSAGRTIALSLLSAVIPLLGLLLG
jgi:hypothetical protein